MKPIPAIALLSLCSCQSVGMESQVFAAHEPAMGICSLYARHAEFVGRQVIVVGELGSAPHGRVLNGLDCGNGEGEEMFVRLASDETGFNAKLDQRMHAWLYKRHKTGSLTVTYSGILRNEPLLQGCETRACAQLVLEEAKVLEVVASSGS